LRQVRYELPYQLGFYGYQKNGVFLCDVKPASFVGKQDGCRFCSMKAWVVLLTFGPSSPHHQTKQNQMKNNVLSRVRAGVLVLSLWLGIVACNEEKIRPGHEQPGTGGPLVGEPTSIGAPTGDKVSQTIGPEGGVIRTADGKVTLIVPAGALTQTTTISLQPIENKAYLGIGSAYEFSPDGLKFAKPAQLAVQYGQQDLAGTSPDAIGIAFQDEKHVWQGTAAKVNTHEGTFTASVPHFSSWAFFKYYSLTPESMNLAPAQIQKMEVVYLKGSYHDPDLTNRPPGEDDQDLLVPLISPKLLKGDQVKNWRVNGSAPSGGLSETYGNLSVLEQGAAAEYKAPSKVPAIPYNPVAVSVELKSRRGQLILVSNLTIAAENEMTINGTRFENPITDAAYLPGLFNLVMTDRSPVQANVAAITASVIRSLKGPNSFNLDENCDVTARPMDDDYNYIGGWIDEQGNTQYGPGTVTITEFSGEGKPVAGTISATLHYQSGDLKVHHTIQVKATFKTSLGSK
jgi:hypothetical protein